MPTGDDAAAAGMALVDGATVDAQTIDTEINLTRDYIAQGKGATDAATASKVVKRDAAGRCKMQGPIVALDVANKAYVDAAVSAISLNWASITGKPSTFPPSAHTHDWVDITGEPSLVTLTYLNDRIGPSASVPIYSAGGPATSGYTIAYINGDNRISRGASSERYKTDIQTVDPLELGDIFPQLHQFAMKDDPDATPRLGYIAERLHESEDLQRFVIYKTEPVLDDPGPVSGKRRLTLDDDGNPIPESIDFIALLLSQVAQMHDRIARLEGGTQ
jgi:hypothetical protein